MDEKADGTEFLAQLQVVFIWEFGNKELRPFGRLFRKNSQIEDAESDADIRIREQY